MADLQKDSQASVQKAPPRPRLGRGLSSLIINSAAEIQVKTAETPVATAPPTPGGGKYVAESASMPSNGGNGHIELAIEHILPNPYQPRREFNLDELQDLAQSIAKEGILQPLIVAANADGSNQAYVLIAGERRLRAARQAGLTKVPCIVRQANPQQMLEWALIENIQRADLNPVEKASAYRDYMDRFSISAVDVAQRLSQPRTTVVNYLRILDLCNDIQKMLVEGSLSFGHAKVLAGLAGQVDRQVELAKLVAGGSLSVRQLESMAAQPPGQRPVSAEVRPAKIKAAYLRDLEERLTAAAGTRVTILPGKGKHRGRIVVEYYSLDDFDRLAGQLGLAGEA